MDATFYHLFTRWTIIESEFDERAVRYPHAMTENHLQILFLFYLYHKSSSGL